MVTTAKKIAISFQVITFLNKVASGIDNPISLLLSAAQYHMGGHVERINDMQELHKQGTGNQVPLTHSIVSQHLEVLPKTRLINIRRKGKIARYCINSQMFNNQLALLKLLAEDLTIKVPQTTANNLFLIFSASFLRSPVYIQNAILR